MGQAMKGRLSKKWGEAQNIYYQINPDTSREKYFNRKAWTKTTIKASIDMSLGMWDDRYKVLHGRTVDEKRKIKREKILDKAHQCFNRQDRMMEQDRYLFDWGLESLENRGVLYLEGCCFSKDPVGVTAGETGGGKGSGHYSRPSGINSGNFIWTIYGNKKSGNIWS